MASTKVELFSPAQVRIAELSKALGHPARIAILQILAQRKTCICGDITDQLPLAQSTVSQHLKALKEAGIIRGEIEGVRTCYCLDKEGFREIQSLLTPFLNALAEYSGSECC
jgi:ArsR family transcriptional regulator